MKLTIAVIGNNKELVNKLKDQQTEHNEVIAATTERSAIKKAKGEYITFVRAKDDVKPHYTRELINKIEESEFDVCFFGWDFINWHNFKFIGFVADFKPIFSAIFKRDLLKDVKENIVDECFERVSVTTNLCKILYSYRGERG